MQTLDKNGPNLEGLHSILDSGLQSLKDSVFSSTALEKGGGAHGISQPPDSRLTLQNLDSRSNLHHQNNDSISVASSTSSKRRNSNLRKLLNEIKSGEVRDGAQSSQGLAPGGGAYPAGKPSVNQFGAAGTGHQLSFGQGLGKPPMTGSNSSAAKPASSHSYTATAQLTSQHDAAVNTAGNPRTTVGNGNKDLSLDSDLAELQRRIAGLETKINSDSLNDHTTNTKQSAKSLALNHTQVGMQETPSRTSLAPSYSL